MSDENFFTIQTGDTPVLAAAVHDGHDVREEVAELLKLNDQERRREEDPFTGIWAAVSDNNIVVHKSRFEFDLNRPKERAVYINPEDAWGLEVWKSTPSVDFIKASLDQYDTFYKDLHEVCTKMEQRFGQFVVFDIHSYNHRREGPDGPPAEREENPEVNIGTATMVDRSRWAGIIDGFISDLSEFDYLGRHLDVRENVKFFGGQFPEYIHTHFAESACCLSIEFKKIFMDEWTSTPDNKQIETIKKALESTIPGILKKLPKT